METEKDLLNKDLEITEDTIGLEKLKEDAELLGHEDIVAKAQEKINALNMQAEAIVTQVGAKAQQVESMGGSMAELEEKVGPVQEEIKEVQQATEKQITELESIENQTVDRAEVVPGAHLSIVSKGDRIEVIVESEIKKGERYDLKDVEYVRIKAAHGTLETDVRISELLPLQEDIEKISENISENKTSESDNKEKNNIESFTEPFGEYAHTIEISSDEEYYKAAEKLKKLGYAWNGNKDLMNGVDNEFVKPPFKLIIEENAKQGTPKTKQVTYIRKGSGKDY